MAELWIYRNCAAKLLLPATVHPTRFLPPAIVYPAVLQSQYFDEAQGTPTLQIADSENYLPHNSDCFVAV
jgi:hypothetical protein